MGGKYSAFNVALACGPGGTYVDVSSYLESEENFGYVWGRQTGLEDVGPGELSFALDNRDGRFTANNAASPLAVPVTKGMGVCWQITEGAKTRYVSGKIQAADPAFRDGESSHAMVVVTADDVLGDAARTTLIGLAESMVINSGAYLWWPLNDVAGSSAGAERSGNNGSALGTVYGSVAFGSPGVPAAVGDDQVQLSCIGGNRPRMQAGTGLYSIAAPAYAANSLGFLGAWVTITNAQSSVSIELDWFTTGAMSFTVSGGSAMTAAGIFGANITGPLIPIGVPTYISIGTTWSGGVGAYVYTLTLYVNGVSVGTSMSAPTTLQPPTAVSYLFVSGGVQIGVVDSICHISHTPTLIHEEAAAATTLANRIAAIAATVPTMTLAALPASFSAVSVGVAETSGQSALDALNDAMRTVQGYMDAVTSGPLTAPSQVVRTRDRDRPTNVSASWDVELDLQGAFDPNYDVTDAVAAVTGQGVDAFGNAISALFKDSTAAVLVFSANDDLQTLYSQIPDVFTAATDRSNRGKNTAMGMESIIIDPFVTATDRWADVLGQAPGDRHELVNLPVTELGIATWDGWLIGGEETHNATSSEFEQFYDRCTPAEGIFNTSRFMSGGSIYLSAGITSAAATMSLATTGPKFTTTDVPVDVIVDGEQITITGCSGATPQVANITRGVNGTAAAAHASGALLELAVASLYGY